MKKTLFLLCAVILGASCNSAPATQPLPAQVTISKERLLDKIKGGWAGQTIGCTYGGPTEFKFNGTHDPGVHPHRRGTDTITSNGGTRIAPGLYDDVYMDCHVRRRSSTAWALDAPVDSPSPTAFAQCRIFVLWHANQAARYNILNGINARPSRGTGSTTPMQTTSTSRSKPTSPG